MNNFGIDLMFNITHGSGRLLTDMEIIYDQVELLLNLL